MRVAKAAVSALRDYDGLADVGEIREQRLAILLIDLRAGGDLHHDVLAVRAVPILAHAVAAPLSLEVLLVAVVNQGVKAVHRRDDHIATMPAVATVRSADLDELLARERAAAVPAVTGSDVHLGFIKKFHDVEIGPM